MNGPHLSPRVIMAIEWNRAPIWESAFKIAEAPMSYLNDLQNRYGNCFKFFESFPTSFKDHGCALLQGLRYHRLETIKVGLVGFGNDVKESFIHLYEEKHLVAILLATAIAFPTTVALTPVSIIADIFAGIIQGGLRLCQGADKDEILSILHKKVIASPVQQGVFLVTSVIALGILSAAAAGRIYTKGGSAFITAFEVFALFFSTLMGNKLYCKSQWAVASLPRFFRPDGYNVFIGGGANDESGIKADFDAETTYQKWRQKLEKADKAHLDDIAGREFAKTRTRTQEDLDKLAVKFQGKFKGIRTWFESGKHTYELFGFSSPDKITKEELKKKFRSLTLQCHPDKFQDDEKKEAEIWFTLVMEARLDVENNILVTKK